MLDKKLLDILVCPLCKGELEYNRTTGELVCNSDKLAYPIVDDIPIMLETEARTIDTDISNGG